MQDLLCGAFLWITSSAGEVRGVVEHQREGKTYLVASRAGLLHGKGSNNTHYDGNNYSSRSIKMTNNSWASRV